MQIGQLEIINKERQAVVAQLMADAQVTGSNCRSACFCEAHLFVRAHRDPAVLEAVQNCDRIFPDGTSLILGARFAGKRLTERHPGPQILLDLCGNGQHSGLKHYFYGGRDGVGERLTEHLKAMYPQVRIVGHESPPFRPLSDAEEAAARERIHASGADVLWVGLGAPKQELWIQRNKPHLKVPLVLAVGAAFEYFSGDQKWAPLWMRERGLEWLYRMTTGGPRLFKRYLKYVPLCTYIMAKEAIAERSRKN